MIFFIIGLSSAPPPEGRPVVIVTIRDRWTIEIRLLRETQTDDTFRRGDTTLCST
jgi:hypothetical protein